MKSIIPLYIVATILAAYTIVAPTTDAEVILEPVTEVIELTEPIEEAEPEPIEVVYDSEEDYYKALITEACELNGLGKYSTMAIAISILETGWWSSAAFTDCHNFYGATKADGTLYRFDNEPAGIESYMRTLKWYIDKGMDTPTKMAKTYCPPNSEHWAREVAKIMEKLNES